MDYVFRTKTGTCTVTPEQIILAREGARGAVAQATIGGSITRVLVTYTALGLAALAYGGWMVADGSAASGVLFCALGALLLWSVVVSRNNSATPVIERTAIRSVTARRPVPMLRRGYFVVLFAEAGQERKRLIMLPGSLSGGRAEYDKALEAMKAAGLLPPA